MRLIFGILFFLILLTPKVFSESLDDFANVDAMWDNQQNVKVDEYDQVIDALEERKEKREEKSWKKKLKKFGGGTSLHKDIKPDSEIVEIDDLKPEDGVLINVPINLSLNGIILEKGYYKVYGKKEDGKFYIEFYQSQFLKGKIEVNEINDDFGEEDINFAKVLPYNESFVKVIFGSIDFNAYAYLPYRSD